jgi:hypothetical protein
MRGALAVFAVASSIASLAFFVACGARTSLEANPPSAAGSDVAVDAPEAGPDVQPGMRCHTDADCADGRWCTSSSHCDPSQGCILVKRDCSDGVACTRDACDNKHKLCIHTPDDTRCPADQLCSAKRDCSAFVYAVASDGHLYEVSVPNVTLYDIGVPTAFASDLAIGHDGTLYATDSYILYSIDRATIETKTIASILPLHMYSGLGTAQNGTLYATADAPTIFVIDSQSGASTANADWPPSYRASGDLTALGSRLLGAAASSAHPQTDTLVDFDTTALGSKVVGDFGYRCVWSLATLGTSVYGLTCEGRVLAVDATSGAAKELAHLAPAFEGAAGR